MAKFRATSAIAALAFAIGCVIFGEGGAQDVRCQRNELVRQIEVQFARDGDGLPCQVIWRGMVAADRTRLVWRSESELEFCTQKARELVHQLIDGGWTCDAQLVVHERGAPAVTVRLDPAMPEADAALPLRPPPESPEPPAPPAEHQPGDARQPDEAALQAALARDVERLDQLTGPTPGRFEVQMARLGDLNGDSIEDAVALLTHYPDGAPPSHHLLAYLYDGQTFQPVARRALTETEGLAEAELQDVVDGVIAVILHVPRPGDPECCPSGRRHVDLVLHGNRLVAAGRRPGA